MLETLDADAVRRWCAAGVAALRRHQGEIDDLNVYPVPDGDTGTNLVLTLTSAQDAVAMDPGALPEEGTTPHGHVLRLMARGALLGARGNSGTILAQILRGLADVLADVPEVRGRALARALAEAATMARAAVARPVDGTLLSVVAAAATGAAEATSDDLGVVCRAAAGAATRALAQTPGQLPVLARAGVVDAGGRGLCVLLDALVEVVTGEPVGTAAAVGGPARTVATETPAASTVTGEPPAGAEGAGSRPVCPSATGSDEVGSGAYDYEVQFLLDADAAAVARMRDTLDALGDSLVVVGDDPAPGQRGTWRVHVHVNDVGAAIEAGVVAGRPSRITVTRFADQPAVAAHPAAHIPPDAFTPSTAHTPPVSDASAAQDASGSSVGGDVSPDPDDDPARAAVVVAPGTGLAELFVREGARVVPDAPSVTDLLDAVRATGARRVVVLPNDPATVDVAGEVVHRAGRLGVRVAVVPTRSPVQALAALAVRDPRRRFDDDVIAMAEAAGACRYAEVRHARREALTVAGRCRPGDVLALVEGEVHLIGADLLDICTTLLDRMLGGGGELVTLLAGTHTPAGLVDALRAHVTRRWPFVEVQAYPGGQPHCPLLVGVE